MLFRPVRGMKDIYGEDIDKYNYIIEKSVEVAKVFGYKIIETPILEYTDVFNRSIGEETDVVSKEMYTFEDKGGESITLRPEGTAGVIRSIVTENLLQTLPLKLMYYGPMFRYDRPQKGRYRQFHQIGCENIGEKTPYTDALTIALSSGILNSVGIFNFTVYINSLGDVETRKAYSKAIVKYFSRHENELSEDSKKRLVKNPLRILDSKDDKDIEICQMAPILSDYLSKDSGVFFEKVSKLLESYGIAFEKDDFLVRGLDYYCHTAFEIKVNNRKDLGAIGGGGRYDNLVKEFGGPDISGIGFALGIERIMSFLDESGLDGIVPKKIYKVAVVPISDSDNDEAFKIIKKLYDNSICAEFIDIGSVTKRVKTADKLGCDMALIIGEDERVNKTITVKFLRSNDSKSKNISISGRSITEFVKYHSQKST
ncbi:MAG: histidine--tRNA ligase [Holosporales bacterium]|jgi:histidyl-tRNA synthetase|nr:histidine--tRNA ligase [Holosporales bacterium]